MTDLDDLLAQHPSRTACCGAPILPRPFQCVHEWEAWLIYHRPVQTVLWP